MGLDDIPMAQMVSPALTTVAQPTDRIGALAMERLPERVAGRRAAGPPTGSPHSGERG